MNLKTKTINLLLGLALLGASTSVLSQEVFFGEDRGTGDNNVPLASTPNANGARDAFFARIIEGGNGTEDFEGFTPGTTAPLVVDFDILTATLEGTGFVANDAPDPTNGDGRYPTSGEQYWDTDRNFTITFDTPVQAVGFYGIDMGDFAGQLTLTYDTGALENVDIPHTVNGPTGSVLYFGLVSEQPFTALSFLNSDQGDVFAFDDFTVQQVVPDRRPPNPSVAIPTNSTWGLLTLVALMLVLGGVAVRRL